MQLIDLSHTIERGMPIFSPDAPQPIIEPWMSHVQAGESGHYAGCTCEVTQVKFICSLGTYLDSPYHFFPGRASIEQLELEQLVLPGVVVDCTFFDARQPIGPEVLDGIDVKGKAILFHTGWSRFWGQPAYADYPFLTRETAIALKERGAKLAGVDFLVIDDTTDPKRPVHVILLQNDVPIVENLTNLRALPAGDFTFHAVPVKVAGAAAFPVRAYAIVE